MSKLTEDFNEIKKMCAVGLVGAIGIVASSISSNNDLKDAKREILKGAKPITRVIREVTETGEEVSRRTDTTGLIIEPKKWRELKNSIK